MTAAPIGVRKPPRTSIKLLQAFFAIVDRDERSYDIIAARAGVTKQTLSYWRHGHRTPSAQALENVLQVLGYRLLMIPDVGEQLVGKPVPFLDTVPDTIHVNGIEYIRADKSSLTIEVKED